VMPSASFSKIIPDDPFIVYCKTNVNKNMRELFLQGYLACVEF